MEINRGKCKEKQSLCTLLLKKRCLERIKMLLLFPKLAACSFPVFLPVCGRSPAGFLFEEFGKDKWITVTAGLCYTFDRQVRNGKKVLGPCDPVVYKIFLRRLVQVFGK